MSDSEHKREHFRRGGIGVGIGAGTTYFDRTSQIDKYHTMQGHGFAAEDANALHDTLRGKSVNKVGTDNAPDGADRIVNGVSIQVKYCKTPEDTYRAFFDSKDGTLRYGDMTWEVPKGQGDAVKAKLREDIRQGKIHTKDGTTITDPNMADEMVREGNVTYEQAKNIAKAGNIDSIKFDAKTQAVTCGLTCGMSFLLTYVNSVRSGKTHKEALKEASSQAAKSGATAMVIGVGTQQLLRTAVGRSMVTSATHASRTVVNVACKTQLGKQVVEKTASTLVGKQIVGQTAKNVLAKGMRTNMVTGGVMLAAQTIPDAIKVCRGKMSCGQFCENTASNAAGLGGGYAGATAGAAIGTVFCPGLGTAIGGIIGGIGGGVAGSSAVRGMCSLFHKRRK